MLATTPTIQTISYTSYGAPNGVAAGAYVQDFLKRVVEPTLPANQGAVQSTLLVSLVGRINVDPGQGGVPLVNSQGGYSGVQGAIDVYYIDGPGSGGVGFQGGQVPTGTWFNTLLLDLSARPAFPVTQPTITNDGVTTFKNWRTQKIGDSTSQGGLGHVASGFSGVTEQRGLQHVGTVNATRGPALANPGAGAFDVWYDPVDHTLLVDTVSKNFT